MGTRRSRKVRLTELLILVCLCTVLTLMAQVSDQAGYIVVRMICEVLAFLVGMRILIILLLPVFELKK